ncbi:transcriptional regulator, TetR family [Burkholderia sp. D7]|nr:transcriptional regulator, TetR family [Burkholderia sp. D7]
MHSQCQAISSRGTGGVRRQTRRSRERILDAAARQISEHGLDSVSVADSMQSAALIKGVFYAQFASREAMIAEAADRVMQHGQARIDHPFFVKKKPTVAEIADVWLDPEHIENLGDGCGICALAGEARYAGLEVHQVIAGHFEKNVEQIAQALGGDRAASARATAVQTALVGAVSMMARAVGNLELMRVILENTRAMVTHPAFLK